MPPEIQTYQLVGGWVRVVVGDGSVDLDAAAPAVGFTMEITDGGPDEVEVRFRSDEHESRFKADWEAGEFRVDIDEKD